VIINHKLNFERFIRRYFGIRGVFGRLSDQVISYNITIKKRKLLGNHPRPDCGGSQGIAWRVLSTQSHLPIRSNHNCNGFVEPSVESVHAMEHLFCTCKRILSSHSIVITMTNAYDGHLKCSRRVQEQISTRPVLKKQLRS
jgi:hypothetical protein